MMNLLHSTCPKVFFVIPDDASEIFMAPNYGSDMSLNYMFYTRSRR